jgi:hypothetical protein
MELDPIARGVTLGKGERQQDDVLAIPEVRKATHWRLMVATTLSARFFHSNANYPIEAGDLL